MTVTRVPRQDGYIVIIVLLLTAVLLMLGLSLATRTTEEVYQSGQEADTTRVFNAAETGIEAALYSIEQGNVGIGTLADDDDNPDPNSFLDVQGTEASDFDIAIPQGEVLTLNWKPGTIIRWMYNANCNVAPAIIVTLYDTTGSDSAYHVAYNPRVNSTTPCTTGSGFSPADWYDPTEPNDPPAGSSVTINTSTFGGITPGPDSIIRIRPLYADGNFRILNSAAIKIISTASDDGSTSEGKETRKIEVIRTEPAAPSIFDYAVFSGGALEKN